MTICARCGRCSRRRRGRFSARSIGRARSASSISGSRAAEVPVGHGQTRRGLGRRRVLGLLARRRRRAGLLQADAGSAGGDRALSVAAGGAAADVGLGPPGRHSRPRRPPDRGVRRVLRAAAASTGSSARRPIRRPRASSSGCRASSETQLRAGPGVRQRARLPGPARRAGSLSAPTSAHHKTLRCRPVDRLLEEREVMAPLPARRRTPTGAGCCGSRPIRTCASTPATTRSTRRWSAGASRRASPTARSSRSRWTPASSPAGTSAALPSTGRSPISRTPERCEPAAREAEPAVEIRPLARYDALIA